MVKMVHLDIFVCLKGYGAMNQIMSRTFIATLIVTVFIGTLIVNAEESVEREQDSILTGPVEEGLTGKEDIDWGPAKKLEGNWNR